VSFERRVLSYVVFFCSLALAHQLPVSILFHLSLVVVAGTFSSKLPSRTAVGAVDPVGAGTVSSR
jgi:hypothetical protein